LSEKIEAFKGRYHFLSNFYLMAIVYEGMKFDSVEHAYQAAKTVIPEEREMIRRCVKPGGAKRLGRSVTLRPGWDRLRIEVMTKLLMQKFSDQHLRRLLLDTGDAELIEGNDWNDTFWGVCRGKGKNNLGKLLMMVRSKVAQFEECPHCHLFVKSVFEHTANEDCDVVNQAAERLMREGVE